MAYIPTVWQNNAVTPVNAENLNHQEAGIVLADTNATNAINRVTVVEASQADAIARLAIINEAEGIRVSNEIAREKKLISIGNRFVKALGTRLSACVESACILVQGDSTGVSNARWFYLIVQWLASKFPKYTVSYRTWNDANQSYDAPTVIQYGTLGDAYISLPSGTGNYISTPDNASLQITGDMDIQAKINGGYYGANIAIVSQFGSLGQRGYDFGLDGAGHLFLWWSSDGTANTYVTSSAIVPVTNGQDLWVMVRFDVDNGSGGSTVAFNTSFDGLTWNQLGTLIVTAGVTTIFNSTVPLEIGSRSGGTTENF